MQPQAVEIRRTSDKRFLPSRARRASRAAAIAWIVPLALVLQVAPAASAMPPAPATSHPAPALLSLWTLSGSPDGTGIFQVDDNIDVYQNGGTVFTQNVAPG